MASSRASLSLGPTICTPTGSPLDPLMHGMQLAFANQRCGVCSAQETGLHALQVSCHSLNRFDTSSRLSAHQASSRITFALLLISGIHCLASGDSIPYAASLAGGMPMYALAKAAWRSGRITNWRYFMAFALFGAV